MRLRIIAVLLLPTVACTTAPPAPRRPAAEVAAAERAFSARAQSVNARDAFVERFAPDAIAYGPLPGPAFPGLREGPPWAVNIRWGPAAVGAACSGDLGWSTGPAEYRRTLDGPVIRRGYYASVWGRQVDGAWKVLIDVGTKLPPEASVEPPWQPGGEGDAPCAPALRAATSASDQIRSVDGAVADAAARDAAAALGTRLHPDARVHLDGRAPAVGAVAARAALAGLAPQRWTVSGTRASRDGALGFSYGDGADLDGAHRFAYLAVWERVGADWWLRLLVRSDVPPPKPAG